MDSSPLSSPHSPSTPPITHTFFDSEFHGIVIPDSEEDVNERVPETPEFDAPRSSLSDLPESGVDSPDSLVDLEDWATDWAPRRRDSYLRFLALICPKLPSIWVVIGCFLYACVDLPEKLGYACVVWFIRWLLAVYFRISICICSLGVRFFHVTEGLLMDIASL